MDATSISLMLSKAFKLHGRIDNEIAERNRPPKADGPHTVQGIGCGNPFTCYCEHQHKQGECHYCHNNTTESAERWRQFHCGD